MPDDTTPGAIPAAPDALATLDPSNLTAAIRGAIAGRGGNVTDGQRPRVQPEGRSAASGVTGA